MRETPMPATIALRPGGQLHLGGTVAFDVTGIDRIKNPGLYVSAFNDAGDLIYGELKFRSQTSLYQPGTWSWTEFVLGGGMSQWVMNPQPAHCRADLYNYSRQGDITQLAGPIHFDAGAGA